jgi:hypothetical protein
VDVNRTRYCFRCRRSRQAPCGPICRAFADDPADMVARTQAVRDRLDLMRRAQGHDPAV